MTETVTRQCADGLHGFCRGDRSTCACPGCHLGPCARCGAENLQKMYDDLCAGCYRSLALMRSSAAQMACDRCGRAGAFRNPVTRRNEFLCVDCHKASGRPLALPMSVQGLVAACHGADVNDDRHEWAHVRGTRFVCTRCKVKSFRPKLRAAMRRDELNG